jgi:uncharacterized protein YcbX
MPTVARVSVAPVKGTAIATPDSIRLERFGAIGNREVFLIQERGRFFSGVRYGPLVTIRSSYDDDRRWLRLDLPDGRVVEGPIEPEGDVFDTMIWGRDVKGRRVAGDFSDAISEVVGQQVVLVVPEERGAGNDSFPVSMVSSASVRELAKHAGGPVDARRFRMLVEVEGTGPHEEDAWIGREVAVGDAVVKVIRQDPRCVVTEQDPDRGTKDLETRELIASYRGLRDGKHADFGVYADVVRPGVIRVGDPVEPLT